MSRIGAASQSRPTSARQALSGHSDVVLGVSAHPTKLMIASSGTDKDLKCIRIWEHVPRPPEPAPAPEAATRHGLALVQALRLDVEGPAEDVADLVS